jgi:hypothetical protein
VDTTVTQHCWISAGKPEKTRRPVPNYRRHPVNHAAQEEHLSRESNLKVKSDYDRKNSPQRATNVM